MYLAVMVHNDGGTPRLTVSEKIIFNRIFRLFEVSQDDDVAEFERVVCYYFCISATPE